MPKPDYHDHPEPLRHIIGITAFRKHMAHYIATVRYGDDWICIKRNHAEPVYLVSQADFDLISDRRDELLGAPRDPVTRMRRGKGMWQVLREVFAAERRR